MKAVAVLYMSALAAILFLFISTILVAHNLHKKKSYQQKTRWKREKLPQSQKSPDVSIESKMTTNIADDTIQNAGLDQYPSTNQVGAAFRVKIALVASTCSAFGSLAFIAYLLLKDGAQIERILKIKQELSEGSGYLKTIRPILKIGILLSLGISILLIIRKVMNREGNLVVPLKIGDDSKLYKEDLRNLETPILDQKPASETENVPAATTEATATRVVNVSQNTPTSTKSLEGVSSDTCTPKERSEGSCITCNMPSPDAKNFPNTDDDVCAGLMNVTGQETPLIRNSMQKTKPELLKSNNETAKKQSSHHYINNQLWGDFIQKRCPKSRCGRYDNTSFAQDIETHKHSKKMEGNILRQYLKYFDFEKLSYFVLHYLWSFLLISSIIFFSLKGLPRFQGIYATKNTWIDKSPTSKHNFIEEKICWMKNIVIEKILNYLIDKNKDLAMGLILKFADVDVIKNLFKTITREEFKSELFDKLCKNEKLQNMLEIWDSIPSKSVGIFESFITYLIDNNVDDEACKEPITIKLEEYLNFCIENRALRPPAQASEDILAAEVNLQTTETEKKAFSRILSFFQRNAAEFKPQLDKFVSSWKENQKRIFFDTFKEKVEPDSIYFEIFMKMYPLEPQNQDLPKKTYLEDVIKILRIPIQPDRKSPLIIDKDLLSKMANHFLKWIDIEEKFMIAARPIFSYFVSNPNLEVKNKIDFIVAILYKTCEKFNSFDVIDLIIPLSDKKLRNDLLEYTLNYLLKDENGFRLQNNDETLPSSSSGNINPVLFEECYIEIDRSAEKYKDTVVKFLFTIIFYLDFKNKDTLFKKLLGWFPNKTKEFVIILSGTGLFFGKFIDQETYIPLMRSNLFPNSLTDEQVHAYLEALIEKIYHLLENNEDQTNASDKVIISDGAGPSQRVQIDSWISSILVKYSISISQKRFRNIILFALSLKRYFELSKSKDKINPRETSLSFIFQNLLYLETKLSKQDFTELLNSFSDKDRQTFNNQKRVMTQ